jgi:hypothetical protein
MPFERIPRPASEVIAEKARREANEQPELTDADTALLASLGEKLVEDTSSADPVSVSRPAELSPGEPLHRAQHVARPPESPGIPNPEVSHAATHPKPPPRTL